ncbi:hypothetical protein ACLKA6_013071 [Drosophila palustris]
MSNVKVSRKEMEKIMEKKLQEVKDLEQREKDRREAVRQLSRVPGKCPVGKCTEIIFPSNLMMHMLHKHTHSVETTTSEVFEHEPLVVCFDPTGYEYGDNQCVASLMYGGVKNKVETLPGLSHLSIPNTALINDRRKFDNHLPIMMIACRSSWYAQLKDKQLERELVALNAKKSGIYVFWLVAPNTTRKLYYTLTVYDRHYLNSRSVVRTVRNYTHFQNPSDFLPHEDDYLVLRDSEVVEFLNFDRANSKLSGKHVKPSIPMEVIIYENPSKDPVRHCSQKELQEALQHVQELYFKESLPQIKGALKYSARGKLSIKRKPHSKTSTEAKLKSILSE